MSTVHQVQSAGAKKKLRQCHRCHQQIQPGYPYQYLRRERRTLYFCRSHPVRPSDTLTGDERRPPVPGRTTAGPVRPGHRRQHDPLGAR